MNSQQIILLLEIRIQKLKIKWAIAAQDKHKAVYKPTIKKFRAEQNAYKERILELEDLLKTIKYEQPTN